MVKTLNALSTKDDELTTLHKMAEQAGEQSYLASFFRPELLDWVEQMVKQDFPPDVWEHLLLAQVHNKTMLSDRAAFELGAKAIQAGLQRELKIAQHATDALRILHDGAEDRAEKFRRELGEVRTNYIVALRNLNQAEAKLTELKARLYDLEHPEV
jgi:hypothetical protein